MIGPNQRAIHCSPSEIEVLAELMRDGATNQDIAKRTFRAEGTVKSHMKRLLQKTQTSNRTHLAVAVARRQVVVLTRAGRVHTF